VHVNLGIISFNKGRLGEAVAHFRKALQIDSENDEALSNLNKTLGILKKIDLDIEKAQKDLTLKPEDPVLNFQLGDMYRVRGDLDKAIAHYQKTISFKPDFPEALYHLAKLYISRREYDKAESLYQKMIDLLPDNPGAYYNVACLYANQNKPEESVAWLKKAIEKGFDDWNQIKIDSDLDTIRSSSHYKAFIKGH
jgi:tetratricopeptide (TPR) repeat protein